MSAIPRSSLRQRPMEECFREVEVHGNVKFVIYDPGNGSRFTLLVTDLSDFSYEAHVRLGYGHRGAFLVTLLDRGSMFVCKATHQVHFRNVQMSFSYLGLPDAIVLAEGIAHLTGLTAISSDEYDEAIHGC